MSEIKLLDQSVDKARRGFGSIEVASGINKMTLPLKAAELVAQVADRLAQVTVKQSFSNPYKEHLEAVYIFPLSGGCAVSSFEMRVADRVITGIVEERKAARTQYKEALHNGKRAALLEQERDDVFTVQVGNLPPGEDVTVVITYSEKLPYFEEGNTEIRLPLVVAPRYIPGSPVDRDSVGDGTELDTDRVPDASRITPPRLAAGLDANVDLSVKVVLSGNESLEDLSCSQHVTKMATSADGVTVSLARENELLDRDFVLRWRVATEKIQSKFLIYKNPEAQSAYGMLSLVPPKCTEIASAPRDVIFVVDRSGSMQGVKMVSAARACSYLLSTLTPRDKFAVQNFDHEIEWMPAPGSTSHFLSADEIGIQKGMDYLRTVKARGGTELHAALTLAMEVMNKRRDTTGRQPVIVLLTDGEVGDEAFIVASLQKELGDLRVFTVGIDTAVNDGFLRKLAAIGGGTATFVEPGTQLEDALRQVSREIGTPLIENLSIKDAGCGLVADGLAPEKMPDLFEGRAVTTFFQLSGEYLKDLTKCKILVQGQFGDGTHFKEEISAQPTEISALAQLWAKSRIVDLEDRYRVETNTSEKNSLHDKIVAIAREHSLLTKFTAFVVVDQSEIVNVTGERRKIVQPVQEPALWEDQFTLSSPPLAAGAAWGAPAATGSFAPMQSPTRNAKQSDSFGAASRSYGSGVRAQVFEVIVREAVAGKPWREICAGPMQVNNIRPEEVEEEVQRRLQLEAPGAVANTVAAGQGRTLTDSLRRANTGFVVQEPVDLKSPIERFEKTFFECIRMIQSDEMPDVNALDKARTDVIAALAQSSNAGSVPLLQKFLRADLIKLIAAITSVKTITKQLKALADKQKQTFEALRSEIADALKAPTEEPFWTSTV